MMWEPWGVLILFLLILLLNIEYFRRIDIERPPIGHFNWKDLAISLVFIVIVPFVYLALPAWYTLLFFTLIFISLSYNSLSPISRNLGFFGISLVVIQYFISSQWINNILIIIIFSSIGTLFIKNGLQAKEIAVFSIILMIYDIVATSIFGQMGELIRLMANLPFFIGLRINEVLVGGGDIAIASLFVVNTAREYTIKKGYSMAISLVFFSSILLFTLTTQIPAFNNTFIPFLVILTPLYLFVYYFVMKRI